MDILGIFFDIVALLVSLVLIFGCFVSKTIVWGRMVGGKPQKITWFGRLFLFLAGSVGLCEFGLAILKRLRIAINPWWLAVALPVGKGVLFLLFLALAVPFIVVPIRDSWLRRKKGETRGQTGRSRSF
jgi:hypothetical protein